MAGCSTSTAAAYENCGGPAMGLYGYPGPGGNFDDGIYRIVATRNKPANSPASFVNACEAMLRARGLIYYRSNPGDCGAPQAIPSFTPGQVVGLSGQAASGVAGGLGAVGAISGAATAGIGSAVTLAVAGLEDFFTHHAQAVQNEQTTICAVANWFNPILQRIDAAVLAGQISPDQGITYVRQVANQAVSGLSGIQKSCNAACVYIGVCKAHADFVATYYPAISPWGASGLAPQAPASAPSTYGWPTGGVPDTGTLSPIRSQPQSTYAPTVPGAPNLTPNYRLPSGCTVNGCAPDYLNLGYNQQTGASGQYAPTPSLTISSSVLLMAAIVLLLVLVLR